MKSLALLFTLLIILGQVQAQDIIHGSPMEKPTLMSIRRLACESDYQNTMNQAASMIAPYQSTLGSLASRFQSLGDRFRSSLDHKEIQAIEIFSNISDDEIAQKISSVQVIRRSLSMKVNLLDHKSIERFPSRLGDYPIEAHAYSSIQSYYGKIYLNTCVRVYEPSNLLDGDFPATPTSVFCGSYNLASGVQEKDTFDILTGATSGNHGSIIDLPELLTEGPRQHYLENSNPFCRTYLKWKWEESRTTRKIETPLHAITYFKQGVTSSRLAVLISYFK